jgi:hypothetical protein
MPRLRAASLFLLHVLSSGNGDARPLAVRPFATLRVTAGDSVILSEAKNLAKRRISAQAQTRLDVEVEAVALALA